MWVKAGACAIVSASGALRFFDVDVIFCDFLMGFSSVSVGAFLEARGMLVLTIVLPEILY